MSSSCTRQIHFNARSECSVLTDHERLEMLGISVDDLHLPVVKFTNGGIVLCQENKYDGFDVSSFVNFRNLFAVAFGMHPSVFFTPSIPILSDLKLISFSL